MLVVREACGLNNPLPASAAMPRRLQPNAHPVAAAAEAAAAAAAAAAAVAATVASQP